MIKTNLLGVVAMILLLTDASYGQESSHHIPSKAAIDACSGKSEGDDCHYINRKGEDRAGTCTSSSDHQLFCKRSRRS